MPDKEQKTAQENKKEEPAKASATGNYERGCDYAANDDPVRAWEEFEGAAKGGDSRAYDAMRAAEGDPHWWRHM